MKNQLALIETTPDWHLSDETREVGLRGIAKARAALAAAHVDHAAAASDQHRSAA